MTHQLKSLMNISHLDCLILSLDKIKDPVNLLQYEEILSKILKKRQIKFRKNSKSFDMFFYTLTGLGLLKGNNKRYIVSKNGYTLLKDYKKNNHQQTLFNIIISSDNYGDHTNNFINIFTEENPILEKKLKKKFLSLQNSGEHTYGMIKKLLLECDKISIDYDKVLLIQKNNYISLDSFTKNVLKNYEKLTRKKFGEPRSIDVKIFELCDLVKTDLHMTTTLFNDYLIKLVDTNPKFLLHTTSPSWFINKSKNEIDRNIINYKAKLCLYLSVRKWES